MQRRAQGRLRGAQPEGRPRDAERVREDWLERQESMERWYAAQAAEPDRAVEALSYEYRPFGTFLGELRGGVLDIGGGAGLAAAYLRSDILYVVLDPSSSWLSDEWQALRRRLAPEGPEPCHVIGVAERMPFAGQSFDAALAFWSLNHAIEPRRCIVEMHRVLRPGGKALLVLEDMEPSWTDTAKLALRSATEALGRPVGSPIGWHQDEIATATKTVLCKLSGRQWPLQDDHVHIADADLQRWVRVGFRILRRSWTGEFLTYELLRL